MTFLLVDDNTDVAEMIQLSLEERGHGCLLARDVEDADWTLKITSVDAMVLDLGLPGRDPLVWLEELGLARPELTRRTLVVAGPTLGDEEILRIHGCGAGILRKPFSVEELREAMLGRAQSSSLAADAGPPRSGASGVTDDTRPLPREDESGTG